MLLFCMGKKKMSKVSELRGDSTMERVKKILGSPMTRKKNIASNNQAQPSSVAPASINSATMYIGVPLVDIVQREKRDIPNLVSKVCTYIYKHGLDCEGVFRVNGNSRIVDKLRLSYDRGGDVDLDEAGDVMAVAGLLKLFLRELPEGLIPERLTQLCVTVQEEHVHETEICLLKLKALLRKLEKPNYETLKYLMQFLVQVAKSENVNKMNHMALGIVFGPNLFRCSSGIQGLKEQGITNHITLKLMKNYDYFFLEDSELSPFSPGYVLTRAGPRYKMPPARPPPPVVDANASPPIPSPRKQKTKPNGTLPQSHGDHEFDRGSSERSSERSGHSDEEFLDTARSNSPFVLDSDRSEYGTLTPRTQNPPATNQLVERAITSAITEHLFGDSSSSNSSDDSLNYQPKGGPVPAPRRKKRQSPKAESNYNTKAELERQLSVKERISQIQTEKQQQSAQPKDEEQPKKQRPKSKAFEMFEERGIIMGMAPKDLSSTLKSSNLDHEDEDTSSLDGRSGSPHPVPKPRSPRKQLPLPGRSVGGVKDESGVDFTDVPHSALDTLNAFKRAPGPKNRRTPSRPKRSASVDDTLMEIHVSTEGAHVEKKPGPPKPRPFLFEDKKEMGGGDEGDVNHNATKPSISFLSQHLGYQRDTSPDKSPTIHRKPCVPPLDLSILHEHGDGNEPIPAEQGHSLSLQKAKQYKEDDSVVLSPRMSKLKQKKNAHPDTDVPPSPPTDQTHIQSKRNDDANAALVKQLTKKIQSYKRKIKVFEETFEQEHGYRPSKSDKVARPEIKRSMQELDKSRKELRKLKDEIENERRAATSSPSGLAVLPNGRTTYGDEHVTSPDSPPTMDETLQQLLRKLEDKREEGNRPEDTDKMTREETLAEKLSVQKALLHFENIHGRPTTKAEKELMRPLYDRYRTIKRILTKPPSPREKMNELQAVPEDQAIEFTPTSSTANTVDKALIKVPKSAPEEDAEEFLVTKDLRLLKDTVRPSLAPTQMDLSPEDASPRNLHELTVPQLHEEQQRAKIDKKRLRKILHDFEDDFGRQTGRKVQKEDRTPMESEYQQYKQVKARLKLVDALLSKHDPLSAY